MPRRPWGMRGGVRPARRRMRRNRPRWTADFADFTTAAGAISSQIILSEADFGTSNTLESECLLHRIIVQGGVFVTAAGGVSTVNWGICKNNENVVPTFGATHDPATVDSLVDDDWLWVGQAIVVYDIDAGFIPKDFSADIRVKRKLISTDTLRFVMTNLAGGVAIDSSTMFRILVEPRL